MITIYPGDTVQEVRLHGNEPMNIVQHRVTRKRRSLEMIKNLVLGPGKHTFKGRGSTKGPGLDGYPRPHEATFVALVKRPWYNHLRALIPMLR